MASSTTKSKLNIETTNKTPNTPVNPILKEIQEKCYESLMDVCRGIAASLNINTNAVMPIQVIKMIVYINTKQNHFLKYSIILFVLIQLKQI